MVVDDKDVVVYIGVEGYFGNYVYVGIVELERYYGEVGFWVFEEVFIVIKFFYWYIVFSLCVWSV